MTRELAIGILIGLAVLLLALGAWGWYRRTRRDGGIPAPVGEAPAGAAVVAEYEGLYVATTRHDDALERLAIRGLAFRSRAALTVTTQGIALDLTGQPRIFLSRDRIAGAGQATVAIDRVVERDGLVRLTWTADSGDIVDSYFRPQENSARTVVAAIDDLMASSEPTTLTGSDA